MPQVLVVQSNRELAESLARVLASRGYRVVVASSCREAEAIFDSFDVGIFDLRLSDGSGTHLAARLSGFGRVRFRIFYTAQSEIPLSRRSGELGPIIRHGTPLEQLFVVVENGLAPAHDTESLQPRSTVRPMVPVNDAKRFVAKATSGTGSRSS